jgi:chaperonin cofactor prefoldin
VQFLPVAAYFFSNNLKLLDKFEKNVNNSLNKGIVMDKAVKIKYLDLIREIDKSVEKLKKEIDSVDCQKRTLNDRLKYLKLKKELKFNIT